MNSLNSSIEKDINLLKASNKNMIISSCRKIRKSQSINQSSNTLKLKLSFYKKNFRKSKSETEFNSLDPSIFFHQNTKELT